MQNTIDHELKARLVENNKRFEKLLDRREREEE